MTQNLDYFKNLDSVPEETNERKKLNTFLLGPTTTGLGIRQNIYRKLNKPLVDFIVYVKNDKNTWDKGKLLYCHLTSNTSDVKIMDTNMTKKGILNDNILTEKGYNKEIDSEADTPRARKMDPSAEKLIINPDSVDTVDTEADTPRVMNKHPDMTKHFLDDDTLDVQDLDTEIGGRKKRTRKQKQTPSRKGKKTKKSRFSAKKSRRNRKNKRKGKTNKKNN
jgi:hypothetical protein